MSFYTDGSYLRMIAEKAANREKGVPVPHTGKRRYRKFVVGAGVSSGSRVVDQPFYDDDSICMRSDRDLRKRVRRLERQNWMDDWAEEMMDEWGASSVSEWFPEYAPILGMWELPECDHF